MLRQLNEDFRAEAGRAIARIESQSHAEVVLVVKERAAGYPEYPLSAGILLAFLALTYFRFAPEVYEDWMIYAGTVAGFVLGAAATASLPALLRLLAGKKRLAKSVEILARACFQKGGIHHTRDKTGMLVFVAVLERQVAIIADRGVELALPPGEWAAVQAGFNGIFQAKNPAGALLAELDKLGPILSRYVPQVADDTNELPDNLDITL